MSFQGFQTIHFVYCLASTILEVTWAANSNVRQNLLHLLLDLFLLEDPDATKEAKDTLLDKQFFLLDKLLVDECPDVRVVAVEGCCRILHLFWEIIPSPTITKTLTKIFEHMIHDSCPEVRLSTVNAVIYLLGKPHSHDILKVLLPIMGHLINDISPPVRAAVVDLLLALTDLRKFQFRVDLDEKGTNSIGGYDKEHFINPSDEGNDESDDIQNVDSIMFPKPSLKRRGSIDDTETSNQVKKIRQNLVRHQ